MNMLGWVRWQWRRRKNTGLFRLNLLDRDMRNRNEAWIRSLCYDVYLGDDTSLCRVLGRFKMFVATSDYSVSAHLLMDGYWEMWLTEEIAAATRKGMVAVDIGANVGYFALIMADLVGPTGRVHAFEPNPTLAGYAIKSARVNGFEGILTVHKQALGAIDGDRYHLVVPPNQLGGAHLAPAEGDTSEQVIPVSTRRFDSYPELQHADIIKIDVEGAEEAVIRGMEELLARRRPLVIFLEFVPIRYADPGALLDYLLTWGFTLSRLDMKHGEHLTTRDQVLEGSPVEDRMLVLRR